MNYGEALGLKIFSKYKTRAVFARKLGWDRKRLDRILNGQQIPNVYDVMDISVALKLADQEVLDIFYSAGYCETGR